MVVADDEYDPSFWIPGPLHTTVSVVGALATVAIVTLMNPIVIAGGVALVVADVVWYFVYVRSGILGS